MSSTASSMISTLGNELINLRPSPPRPPLIDRNALNRIKNITTDVPQAGEQHFWSWITVTVQFGIGLFSSTCRASISVRPLRSVYCPSHPPPDRAVLIGSRCVFAIRLAVQNLLVGNRILSRPFYVPQKQPYKSCLLFYYSLLLTIHVKQVQFPQARGEALAERSQQPPHHRRAKGIEQKYNARTLRQGKLHRIRAHHPHVRLRSSGLAPNRHVLPCRPHQRRIKFHSQHLAKRRLRGQQHRTPHPCPKVDKSSLLHRCRGPAASPATNHRMKYRRCNAVVGCRVTIMPMSANQVPSGDETARTHIILHIERVPHISVRHRKPRQLQSLAIRNRIARCGSRVPHRLFFHHTNKPNSLNIKLARLAFFA